MASKQWGLESWRVTRPIIIKHFSYANIYYICFSGDFASSVKTQTLYILRKEKRWKGKKKIVLNLIIIHHCVEFVWLQQTMIFCTEPRSWFKLSCNGRSKKQVFSLSIFLVYSGCSRSKMYPVWNVGPSQDTMHTLLCSCLTPIDHS